MINCDDLIPIVLKHLKTCSPGEGLEVKTFKGDRLICIIRKSGDGFAVTEIGFENANYHAADEAKLKKLLKTLSKREFPRSNKLRTRHIMGEAYD